jgi:hypothetical protein
MNFTDLLKGFFHIVLLSNLAIVDSNWVLPGLDVDHGGFLRRWEETGVL